MFRFEVEYEAGESIKIRKVEPNVGEQVITVTKNPGAETFTFEQTWPDQPTERVEDETLQGFYVLCSKILHTAVNDIHKLSHSPEIIEALDAESTTMAEDIMVAIEAVAKRMGADVTLDFSSEPSEPKPGEYGFKNAAFN